MKITTACGLVAGVIMMCAGNVFADKDAAIVTAYPYLTPVQGASVIGMDLKEYDEAELPMSKLKSVNKKDVFERSIKTEGKVTKVLYFFPDNTSTLAVIRHYERNLKAAGFVEVYTGAGDELEGYSYWNNFYLLKDRPWLDSSATQRYVILKKVLPAGDVYVAIYATNSTSMYVYQVNLVETESSTTGQAGKPLIPATTAALTVPGESAEYILDTLSSYGKVNLYGIVFQPNKADIRVESLATLQALASVLNNDKTLKLKIICHTENTGDPAILHDLSNKRAEKIVDTLLSQYHVEGFQLTFEGRGSESPISMTDQSKNVRVEVIKN